MSAITELSRLQRGRRPLDARERRSARRDNKAASLFLLPWLLGLVIITAGPMIASLYLSFTDYNLLENPSWVGLSNYLDMLTDERLHQSLKVTLTYVVVGVPLQLAVALLIAVGLNKGMRGLSFYRSVFYLPSLLGGSVAIAILWRQIFGTNGLVNQVLALVGIEGTGWISSPDTALGTIILLHVWTFGAPMIIFLAGLRQIPTMYYEAAAVDGAGKVSQFWRITMPLLTPIIFFNVVLQTIGAFQSFTQAFIISGGIGGPSDSTLFYTMYLYNTGFKDFEMGYASAMAWLLVAIVGALTVVNFIASKYWVHYDN